MRLHFLDQHRLQSIVVSIGKGHLWFIGAHLIECRYIRTGPTRSTANSYVSEYIRAVTSDGSVRECTWWLKAHQSIHLVRQLFQALTASFELFIVFYSGWRRCQVICGEIVRMSSLFVQLMRQFTDGMQDLEESKTNALFRWGSNGGERTSTFNGIWELDGDRPARRLIREWCSSSSSAVESSSLSLSFTKRDRLERFASVLPGLRWITVVIDHLTTRCVQSSAKNGDQGFSEEHLPRSQSLTSTDFRHWNDTI